jgi:hypothetical protein
VYKFTKLKKRSGPNKGLHRAIDERMNEGRKEGRKEGGAVTAINAIYWLQWSYF